MHRQDGHLQPTSATILPLAKKLAPTMNDGGCGATILSERDTKNFSPLLKAVSQDPLPKGFRKFAIDAFTPDK